ncbi:MAG: thioredoxin family protein [Verrucomicrobia bacterium]|nr:thioredoxin family protein [Verrucomicrobiota bacterium]
MRRWAVLLFTLFFCIHNGAELPAAEVATTAEVEEGDQGIIQAYTSSNEEIVAVKMIPENLTITPGKPLWVCFQFDIAPEWHLYAKNSGDIGLPPSIQWTLPEGFRAGDIVWPEASKITIDKTAFFGYSHSLQLLVPIFPPDRLQEGSTTTLQAKVDWLGCSTICVPGHAYFRANLLNSAQQVVVNKKAAALFKSIRSTEQVVASLPAKAVESNAHLDSLEQKVWYRQLLPSVQGAVHSDFFKILLLAFLGGIILNIMPCVLPVISLKLLHFVQLKEHNRKAVVNHGFSYTLGVLVSFWVLVGMIYVLQSFGKTVGWGFQLQEPIFVAVLLIVLFIFSLSLFGVFEFIPSLASAVGSWERTFRTAHSPSVQAPSYMASFFSGVLAAFVASPCTGPLLGSAIGFAATLDPIYSFAIFSSLAIGMAFPFLVVSIVPGASRLIPRPGRWMVTFKQLMGFFMLATCLWLVWVLDAETNGLSIMTMLITLFIISFGVWIYGIWGGLDRPKRTRIVAKCLALLVIIYGSYLLIADVQLSRQNVNKPTLPKNKSQVIGQEWEHFSPAVLERLRSEQMPIFVYATAKWCLTCQANHAVLEREAVKEAFVRYGVIKLEADWTNGDEAITQYIRGLGRNGVPLAVVYSRNPKESPKILPEVLTPEIVIEALKWAHGG